MKTRIGLVMVTVAMAVGGIVMAESTPKYEPTWESLATHRVPEWFDDAKLGIFIHWGPYAVPGWGPRGSYAEHYASRMYFDEKFMAHHSATYGEPPAFGYKDFIPLFKAEHFDAGAWAQLFREAGARYVVPVAEHHDGFAMWDSALTTWDARDRGPKRDIIGELEKAVRAQGMKFGPSTHRERHFSFYRKGFASQNPDPEPYPGVAAELDEDPSLVELYGPFDLNEAFMEDYKARWEEICDKYRPDILWFDDIPVFYFDKDGEHVSEYKALFAQIIADYLNKEEEWGQQLVFNNKGRTLNWPKDCGVLERDYMKMDKIPDFKWQNPCGIGHSFGFNQNEEPDHYLSVRELVHRLADVVSKNGNLLLNVGPRADGTISDAQQTRLRGLGEWLKLNGEAIYATRPWKTFGEEGVRFTRSKESEILFAILLDEPEGSVAIKSLGEQAQPGVTVRFVEMLGVDGMLKWKRDADALTVELPEERPCEHAHVLRIETE